MFSVILPVYNGEKFIETAIRSVFAQTCGDWELIIVNDGSKDHTADVLRPYAAMERVRVITQENGGVSSARNAGMAAAKGTHFAFLDADDVWHENHLAIMSRLIAAHPDAGLYGTFTRCELVNGGEINTCAFFENRPETVYLDNFFDAYHKDKSAKMFTMITTCVTREAAAKAGGFPVGCKIGEDLEFSLRIAAYYPVVLCSIPTATYKKENSVATRDRSFDPDWGFFDGVQTLLADESIPAQKRESLRLVMGWFTMRRCRHYLIAGERGKARQACREVAPGSVGRKDMAINRILLCMPTGLVRKIFALRWRGRA